MDPDANRNDRKRIVFLLGCFLLQPPFLTLFARPVEVLGLPLFYVYLYLAWAGLIVLIALAAGRGKPRGRLGP